METWLIEGLDRVVNYMVWDGIALIAFVSILLLGIHFYHPRIGLLVAICIPVSSAILLATQDWSFVEYAITYVMMVFFAVVAFVPIYARST